MTGRQQRALLDAFSDITGLSARSVTMSEGKYWVSCRTEGRETNINDLRAAFARVIPMGVTLVVTITGNGDGYAKVTVLYDYMVLEFSNGARFRVDL